MLQEIVIFLVNLSPNSNTKWSNDGLDKAVQRLSTTKKKNMLSKMNKLTNDKCIKLQITQIIYVCQYIVHAHFFFILNKWFNSFHIIYSINNLI